MKYITLGFAMLSSIGWNILQSNNAENNKFVKIQIDGEIQGSQDHMVLKIEGNDLTLKPSDRFTPLAHAESQELLTIHIVAQPDNQQCEVFKSNITNNAMHLNISCQNNIINNFQEGDVVDL
ncbi:MAG: hypothetical protein GY951_05460 [Psychromonas sp.]|nr:hypothetical protein [Alteromonadales bacterium]MCP5077488.1 hypothetical protein [Psychromonas sp.]